MLAGEDRDQSARQEQEGITPRERTWVKINGGSTEPDSTKASNGQAVTLAHPWPGKQILLNSCFLTSGNFSKKQIYAPLSSPQPER